MSDYDEDADVERFAAECAEEDSAAREKFHLGPRCTWCAGGTLYPVCIQCTESLTESLTAKAHEAGRARERVLGNDATSAEGYTIDKQDETLTAELWYPRVEGKRIRFVEVGLVDVRAADSVRVSYDFERDGWKIEQAGVFEWDMDDSEQNPGWAEVAFVQAWGSQRVPPKETDE